MSDGDDRRITLGDGLVLHLDDVAFNAVRASGPGGQNVNKVSSAVQLRYDLHRARLPPALRERLLRGGDRRISDAGVLVIKAQRQRTQARNREEALERLCEILRRANRVPPRRIATRPTRSARLRRLAAKGQRGELKRTRRRPGEDD